MHGENRRFNKNNNKNWPDLFALGLISGDREHHDLNGYHSKRVFESWQPSHLCCQTRKGRE